MLGIDPGPFTLRELMDMAEGRARERWTHTSWLLAMMANVNRDPKKSRVFHPDDFNPYAERRPRGIPITAGNIGLLKALLKSSQGRRRT